MLSNQALQHILAKWSILYPNRPSTFRNSVIFWILRVLFNLIILISFAVLMTTFSREMWLPAFEEVVTAEDYEAMDALLVAMRGTSIFFITISGIIVWLSRSAIRRNNYIVQVEELMTELESSSITN
ncbi:MAG: hypothetical protein F9K23_16615 [Bacteroidetes bacterium]|nr:MAG: hypothetical protein F9K23_16615 [Bacteroidota bacterium]